MKKKSKLLYDGIILLGIVLVACTGAMLYKHYADRAASNSLYEKLNEQYVMGPQQSAVDAQESNVSPQENDYPQSVSGGESMTDAVPVMEETPWHDLIRVDFESLKEYNPDVIGWIFFEDEEISYPILYSGDNVKYLRTTVDGKNAAAGSIFLDGSNTPDLEDSRSVIYGHNMKNLSMFGNLKYYMQEKDYYEDHQYFQILVEDKVYRYRIFSYFDVPETETEICRVDFASEKDFADFIKKLKKRSVKDTEIEVNSDDKVVTLLTCFVTGRRTLVNAVRVDSYEIEAVTPEK